MSFRTIQNILLIILLTINFQLFSQENKIDSLKNELSIANSEDKAALYSEIADLYIHISPSLSQKYIIQAIIEANTNNNIKLFPEIYRIYGIIKYYQNEIDSSLFYYNKSKEIAEELNDKLAVASANVNIGVVYFETNEYTKALSSLCVAQEIFKKEGVKENEAIINNNIGLIYKELNMPDSALFYLNNSLQIKKELQNELGQAYTLINMAIVEYKFNNNDTKAISYFNIATDILLKNTDTNSIAILYNEQGNFHFYKNNLDKAQKFYLKSLRYSTKIQSYKIQKDSYDFLFKIAIARNNDSAALDFYQKFITCKDTIENQEIIKNLNELKLKYETEQKEQKITFLSNEQKLKNKQIKLQQKIIFIFIISFIAILVFFIIVYFQNKQLSFANKKLTSKNIEVINSEKQLLDTKIELETIIENIGNKETEHINKHFKLNIEKSKEQKILSKILKAFEKDNIYLDKNISINDLSKKIDSNKTYVSHVINKEFGMNFNNFVNKYRIKKATEFLACKKFKNYTIEAIAKKSGFTSVTVFNKAFKKFTGLTPSNFIKNLPKE